MLTLLFPGSITLGRLHALGLRCRVFFQECRALVWGEALPTVGPGFVVWRGAGLGLFSLYVGSWGAGELPSLNLSSDAHPLGLSGLYASSVVAAVTAGTTWI